MKSVTVSEMVAHKLISRFLEREGREEIALHENLTRLQTVCQSLGSAKMQALGEALITAPSTKVTPTVSSKKKESSKTTTEKERKRRDKSEKSAENEDKKSAKKERKEKRKREGSDSGGKKKRRMSVDSSE